MAHCDIWQARNVRGALNVSELVVLYRIRRPLVDSQGLYRDAEIAGEAVADLASQIYPAEALQGRWKIRLEEKISSHLLSFSVLSSRENDFRRSR